MSALPLFRRYAHQFVNAHDFTVPLEIMSPDYTLHTGPDVLSGRDDPYLPAVAHQMSQFPHLSYTVHSLVVDADSVGVLFTEHGRSERAGGHAAAWPGIAIYTARHGRLAECWVEQDYYGRRTQLASGSPDPLLPIEIDAWDGHDDVSATTDPSVLDAWAASVRVWPPREFTLDPGAASDRRPRLDDARVSVVRVVRERNRFVAIVSVTGHYAGGLPEVTATGDAVVTMRSGLVGTFDGETIGDVIGVTNRLSVQRQLASGS